LLKSYCGSTACAVARCRMLLSCTKRGRESLFLPGAKKIIVTSMRDNYFSEMGVKISRFKLARMKKQTQKRKTKPFFAFQFLIWSITVEMNGQKNMPVLLFACLPVSCAVFLLFLPVLFQPPLSAHVLPPRVYIACDDHTDYMWSANEDEYHQAFLDMLDYYLDRIDSTRTSPPDLQMRFNPDGSYWLWVYERNRSPEQFRRLIERVRDGHLGVPMTALQSCYGGTPLEAVLRGMYYAGNLERRFGLKFELALSVENQTLPWGLGSLWAGSGARYSWRGICDCATRIKHGGDREHEVYWWSGPDSSRILMKWYSMPVSNAHLGGYAEARDPASVVEYVTRGADSSGFAARHPCPVIGAFGKGWDDLRTISDEFVRVAETLSDSTRRVIVSNEVDYFRDLERTCGENLPAQAVSFGNEWELLTASLAEPTASVRRSVEKLRAAEALVSLVALHEPEITASFVPGSESAMLGLGLYWEHDWTADGPVSRNARAFWQRKIATQVESYVDSLHLTAQKALGSLIPGKTGDDRFFVFNPLGWTRTDMADIPWTGSGPVHVLDPATGLEVPSQRIYSQRQFCLRILADSVPPLGYRVYEVRGGAGKAFPDAAKADISGRMENGFYSLVLNPRGALTSLVDKKGNGREYADSRKGHSLNDLGPGGGRIELLESGPVSVTLRAVAEGPVPHETYITLIQGSPRIEIVNRITGNFGDVLTWNFGFNLENSEVHHEEVGAVVRAARVAEGGIYAARNVRCDWLSLNHFVDIGQKGDSGVTLSNSDCSFFRLGNSTVDSLDTLTPAVAILAGGQVDGPALGIPDQGGDSLFLQRFALRTRQSFDAVEAMRFALEHQNPLVAGRVTGAKSAPCPPLSYSLLHLDNASVLPWTVKPAEEGIGQGMIVRLWNLSDQPQAFALGLNGIKLTRACTASHIETDTGPAELKNGSLHGSLRGNQVGTWRLLPQ
jgi:alpha-mannosidase